MGEWGGKGARRTREATSDSLQIAANRQGSLCNALFHETIEQLIRCEFMKHRFRASNERV